ncbi:hypothetical protein RclHR1_19550002 [Rhizophagus clarus]|uniref:Cytochrome P450 n=1 Tax=Rhizophagus clarus TaxID=94130 RepID=A0A2Z6QPM9_9GLOM|nr:hypothetical protein RclHR1_19550002 [Rhizophagus clarus]GES74999.1 cytochrome P450 [Rhizophagus clarus]
MTYVSHYYYTYFTRVNPLPGPFPFPFIGNLPQVYLRFNGDIQMFYNNCYKKYGDIYEIYRLYGNERSIVLCRSEYLKNFLSLSLKNAHWMRFPNRKGSIGLGIEGKGVLFNDNYKSWMFNRQFFSQAILSPKFTDEAIDWTNKLFNELESYWDRLFLKKEIIKENKNILDLSGWFNNYANDITIKLLTGERSYSMAAYFDTFGDEKSDHPSAIINDSVKFVKALHKQLLSFQYFLLVPSFLRNYIPFFKNKENDLIQNRGFVNQKLDVIIKRRRQEIGVTPLGKPLPHDMLTSMIIKNTPRDVNYVDTGEVNRSMTDAEIRVNLIEAVLGGYKSASMFTLIIYYIAHNSDVKKKMLEEIDSIFHDKIRPITKDDFYNLSYCEAIVKEVARIFPITHSFARRIDQPDKIGGYQWPADTSFLINIRAINNDDDYWEEPNKFNPDRWMVEGFEPKKNSFITFGGGVRSCPGKKLAMIELVCLMVLLFRKYEIDLIDKHSPIKTKSRDIIISCGELLVEIKPRS